MAGNDACSSLHQGRACNLTASRRVTLLIFLLALGVRLTYVGIDGREQWQAWPDSRHYEKIGWRLARGVGYDDPSESPPAIYRPPLLPFVIAAVYRTIGQYPLAVQSVQAVLGGGAAVLSLIHI